VVHALVEALVPVARPVAQRCALAVLHAAQLHEEQPRVVRHLVAQLLVVPLREGRVR
jgi:hypothetical protein